MVYPAQKQVIPKLITAINNNVNNAIMPAARGYRRAVR